MKLLYITMLCLGVANGTLNAKTLTINENHKDKKEIIQKEYQIRTDLVDNDKEYEIFFEVPGVKKDNINIKYIKKDNKIILTIKRKELSGKRLIKEIQRGIVKREVILPEDIVFNKEVSVKETNGMISIKIKKDRKNKEEFSLKIK